ncbi:DUF72 domain-containing protein [Spirulina sp. CS-785/01]|uniref:DUF72 domain-containing protein n=1 Tax=Spirulina sp. CS-785/01 TaxID=3021716 RepID=UPI0023304B0C|nr:DUF72 domain-containing protein [Spirulina sp. CS-785/01]MDB9311837.1 DUF72 domain-containing protein [Spirulina sp. CS-785/01]
MTHSQNFYLGCAVWSYSGWVGSFYPAKSKARDFLKLYCDRFSTVEGNTTFYAVPSPDTIAKWQTEMPPHFKFCPKFPKTITHHGALTPKLPEAEAFLERLSPLGSRLGVIFLQLPPTYSPQGLADLQQFLQDVTRNWSAFSFAVEVRHPDWFQSPHSPTLNTTLQSLNVGRVILDTRPVYETDDDPQHHSRTRKPQLPLVSDVTADFTLIRFISHPHPPNNQPFLADWASRITSLLRGKTIYFFVHCPQEEYSPHTARQFQTLLQHQNLPIPPLPWDTLPPTPQQLNLF